MSNSKPLVVLVGVILLFGAIILLPQIGDIVVASGNHLDPYQGPDLIMDYVLGWMWALFLWIVCLFVPIPRKDRQALILVWGAKIIMTLLLALAYEYMYGLDMDGYFLAVDHWEGLKLNYGTANIRQLVWLHTQLIPDSYHAAKVSFAAIGMTGCYFFYRAFVLYTRREDPRAFYILSLFPSVLLWSSYLGKEPIMFFGMGLYAYSAMSWLRRRRWRDIVLLGCGVVVVAYVRPWYMPLLLGSFGVMAMSVEQSPVRRWAAAVGAFVALGVAVHFLGQSWHIESSTEAFEFRNKTTEVAFSGGGSSFEPVGIDDPAGFALAAPTAVFRALFRPFPLEVPNVAGTLQGFENVFYLSLLWLAIRRTRKEELLDPAVLWLIVLVVTWGVFYGSVVTNFGSLARYKLQIQPFLFGLLLYLSRRRESRQVLRSPPRTYQAALEGDLAT